MRGWQPRTTADNIGLRLRRPRPPERRADITAAGRPAGHPFGASVTLER